MLSATWWSLRLLGTAASSPPVQVAIAPPANSDPADLAKVLGPPVVGAAPIAMPGMPLVVDPGKRFALLGVVANRSKVGVALISVDGKAARPYRVGSAVEEAYVLKSVATRSAVLAPAARPGPTVTLELPIAPIAATAVAFGLPATMAPAPPLMVPAVPPPPTLQLPGAIADPVSNPSQLQIPRPGLPPALRPGRPGERGTL